MSALGITIQALKAASNLSSLVGTRIFPLELPAGRCKSALLVTLIYESTYAQLPSPSEFYNARMQITCMSDDGVATVNAIGEAVKKALEPLGPAIFGEFVAWFVKEGTDVISVSPQGAEKLYTRTMDFYVKWRPVGP